MTKESEPLHLGLAPTYKAAEGTSSSRLPADSPSFGNVDGQGHNNVPLTAGLLVADVIGAGILSAAVAVADLGWLAGAVAVVVLLCMNMHTSVLMWRVRIGCPDTHTYMGLVNAAFSAAPLRWRKTAVALTGFAQYASLFGTLCLYTLSFGKSIGMALHDVHICLPIWTALGCVVLLPFVLTARSMGSWPSLIWFNILTIVGTIMIPLWEMARRAEEGISDRGSFHAVAPMTMASSVAGLSKVAFSFSSQFMVVEIISEMKEPADFPKAYLVSAPFQGFVVLFCGLGGYYYLGSNASGMIIDNVPFGPALQLAAVSLLLHMLVTYLLKGMVFCRAIHSFYDRDGCNEDDRRGWFQWCMIVSTTLAGTWFTAQLVPFFADLMELLGGTCVPLCCFVIPIVTYVQWARTMGEPQDAPSKLEWCAIACELALAITLMIAVPIFSAKRISKGWHDHGEPFSCHCEGLWNSCGCSPDRPGMEYCHSAPHH